MIISSSLRRVSVPGFGLFGRDRNFNVAKIISSLSIFAALALASEPALAQFTEQGPKLIGGSAIGDAEQGSSVAISADGNTMIEGGPQDNSGFGAAWVFIRSGTTWTQQAKLIGTSAVGTGPSQGTAVALSADGNTALVGANADNSGSGGAWVFVRSGSTWTQQAKLRGTGYVGGSSQGTAVGLSADGNTAIIGGPEDNSSVGAAWIFARTGTTWNQQGAKLIGTGYVGNSNQGQGVALSGDGNTALVGGDFDNGEVGAVWVYARSGSTWTQQGNKLIGNGASGAALQGSAVALSEDGNTAIESGTFDNNSVGATWVFTRSGTTWTQQGSKLVGSGNSGQSSQGNSIALSANGNIAFVAGSEDNSGVGASWVFTRSGSTWTQQGTKLIGANAVGHANQGMGVALSGRGTTAIIGGFSDNSTVGATWVFAAPNFNPVATHDFNGDGTSDILWRDTSGDTTVWFLNNGGVTSGTGLGNVPTAWSVATSRDFDSNGSSDMLWRDTSGDTTMWLMSGGSIAQGTNIGNIPTAWSVVGSGDFNGDGKGDILWHDTSGDTTIWFMNGGTIMAAAGLGTVPLIWSVAGVGDFNGDGTSDILWHDIYGDVSVWEMSGGSIKQGVSLGNVATNWSIVGTGDFNSDGTSDVLWRDTAGDVMIWLISNCTLLQQSVLGNVATTWSVAETGDFNGDGYSDILWIDTSGNLMIWYMNGLTVTSAVSLGNVGTAWSVQGASAD